MYKFILNVILFSTFSFLTLHAQEYKIEQNTDSLNFYLQAKKSRQFENSKIEILYEIGTVDLPFIGDQLYTYQMAFKVYDISGLRDLGEIIIHMSNQGALSDVSGTTYNLDGAGNVTETKLVKKEIIEQDLTTGVNLAKFSIPGIKNGSVVTYKYTVRAGMTRKKWHFQKDFPVLYSRFNYNCSEISLITSSSKTSVPFKKFESIKKMEKSRESAVNCVEIVTHSISTTRNIQYNTWIRRNIQPYVHEPLSEHDQQLRESVIIYFNGYSGDGYTMRIVENWENISKKWHEEEFAEASSKNKEVVNLSKSAIASLKDSLDMAKSIFNHIQQNFVTTGKSASLKTLLATKQGNQKSINELLCAAYKNAGFQSHIVLVANKYSEKLSPFLYNVNNITDVIVAVIHNNVMYFSDASQKDLPFGFLPLHLYNGYARIVNDNGGAAVELHPYLARNVNSTSVTITPTENQSKAGACKFVMKKKFGQYDGISLRKSWKDDSILFKQKLINKDYSENKGLVIQSVYVENTDNLDNSLILILEGDLDFGTNFDQIILNPFFEKLFEVNPLGNDISRKHDIEYPNGTQENYSLTLKLPKNYGIEQIPQSLKLQFGEKADISYSQKAGFNESINTISLKTRYEHAAVKMQASEAGELQNFYTEIIKSLNSKVILKKIDRE